ncbi:class I SAM-dependent methyltransferase [Leptolyngbya sp. PCC 6406]|uniref:class I SAM-dependent methyltransferase n=1 Tax=Leptolyngbya sp. PCC 6406 TaxID=1173264 RepID=UPI0002ABA44E|nr:SAM-dependent methyltransferase [Leptolyngbya sp. PCC 6406]
MVSPGQQQPLTLPSLPHHLPLCEAIVAEIATAPQQRISFARYMDLVLYHPDHGYYTRSVSHLGPGGDFVTSVHLGHDFGELLAEQVADIWHHLDRPQPFDLVEFGPGQGLMAADILAQLARAYPTCLAALRYTLVETSPALRQVQQQRLQPWQDRGISLQWCALDQVPEAAWMGCVLSNELVDALPVHRVVLTEAGLQEQYVVCSNHPDLPFCGQLGPLSTPDLGAYLSLVGVAIAPPTYPLGYTTEINLAALDWLAAVARCLHRGYVITIDYGYEAHRYYSPTRTGGTLQCYRQQAHHSDPWVGVGQQDITAHVDFTALQRQGDRCGLSTVGFTPQAIFLMALGLGDRLNAVAQTQGTDGASLNRALQRRDSLHQLISPLGLGNFGVLVQQKGVPPSAQQQPLKGLTVPEYPHREASV